MDVQSTVFPFPSANSQRATDTATRSCVSDPVRFFCKVACRLALLYISTYVKRSPFKTLDASTRGLPHGSPASALHLDGGAKGFAWAVPVFCRCSFGALDTLHPLAFQQA